MDHDIQLPRRVIVGKDVLGKVGNICEELGFAEPVLLISGPQVMEIAGKTVLKSMLDAGIPTDIELITTTDPEDLERILRAASQFRTIIGCGGGKVIDVAKWTAHKLDLPFISVPTAPSHDGICSNRVTIFDSNGVHYSCAATVPEVIAVDMDVIAKAPFRMIASGAADVIAKLTAIADWKLSHEQTGEPISDYSAALALLAAEIVIKSAKSIRACEEQGLRNLIEALISSGVAMCIAGSSRPASGSEHLFSHALDALWHTKKSLHGEQCGVGTIMAAYMHGMPWQMVRDTLKQLGAPVTAKELGIPPDVIVEALVRAKDVRNDRYTILHAQELNTNRAQRIAKATGVI
ncbi:MAG: NAD(P)-dependent glycerol-1-phosphate dehydrogenase [Candidatus Aenigmarchaeota archaeon]|nr:NAD(P)-dependent glycerol-1-phosphate dehydrogenase [Candidatus Aenigmarchaeota archaeon]